MKLYTYRDVATMFGVSVQLVRLWVRTGRLDVMRLSTHTVRISQDALDAFVLRHKPNRSDNGEEA